MNGRRWIGLLGLVVYGLFSPAQAAAEVQPASIRSAQEKVWRGQRAPFFVELRGKGPFVGAASFSLPQVARTVIVKVGNPVVSSEEIDDQSWFIQTHEFALFSQASGQLTIPSFEVRFTHRDGFTGPEIDQVVQVPSVSLEIEQPPDMAADGFVVTTDQFEITESWKPSPGSAKQGDVVQRVITQQAEQMTGMALAPPPTEVGPGIRVYLDQPEVTDKTERGEFSAVRRDRITYLFEQPGRLTIPAIQYVWWNPEREEYGSKTLPAVTFDVAAVAVASTEEDTAERRGSWIFVLLMLMLVVGLLVWQRGRVALTLHQFWQKLNPPERVAARRLLKACRQNDPRTAAEAWLQWEVWQPPETQLSSALQQASIELQRHLYGPETSRAWQGEAMRHAFQDQRHHNRLVLSQPDDLPPLNPAS